MACICGLLRHTHDAQIPGDLVMEMWDLLVERGVTRQDVDLGVQTVPRLMEYDQVGAGVGGCVGVGGWVLGGRGVRVSGNGGRRVRG